MQPLFVSKRQAPGTELTEKEKVILEALANDLSVKMIARKLVLSEYTVQDYIKKIKVKLGAHTAVGIVAMCLRSGQIE
jgi:DNA-binding NarL/FixJ family response regulator